MTKQIRLSEEVYNRLFVIKEQKGHLSFDSVIRTLLHQPVRVGVITVGGPGANFVTNGHRDEVEVNAAIAFAAMHGNEVVVNITDDYPVETIEQIRRYARKRSIKVYLRKDDIETELDLLSEGR